MDAQVRATVYWLWALLFALSVLFAVTFGSIVVVESIVTRDSRVDVLHFHPPEPVATAPADALPRD